MSNKEFWDLVKPFLSNKEVLNNGYIYLVKNETTITDHKELAEIFTDHFVNTVDKSNGKKPNSFAKDTGISGDREIVRLILCKYKNHPSAPASYHSKPREYWTPTVFKSQTIKTLRNY